MKKVAEKGTSKSGWKGNAADRLRKQGAHRGEGSERSGPIENVLCGYSVLVLDPRRRVSKALQGAPSWETFKKERGRKSGAQCPKRKSLVPEGSQGS